MLAYCSNLLCAMGTVYTLYVFILYLHLLIISGQLHVVILICHNSHSGNKTCASKLFW